MTIPVEHGIKLGGPAFLNARLKAMIEQADRVYLGPEFCENLLETAVCSEVMKYREMGKKVCLLTPLLTEKGVKILSTVFKRLLKLHRAGRLPADGLEITVNDFGALELAAREKLPFKLNAGRLFSLNVFTRPRDGVTVLSRPALDFFAQRGINRYEISTTGARLKTNYGAPGSSFPDVNFGLTLYYPYLPLAATRTCMVGMQYIAPADAIRTIVCGRECSACTFKVAHPGIKEKLLVRGNAVFLDFPGKFYSSPKTLRKLRVDRLVYCPVP